MRRVFTITLTLDSWTLPNLNERAYARVVFVSKSGKSLDHSLKYGVWGVTRVLGEFESLRGL